MIRVACLTKGSTSDEAARYLFDGIDVQLEYHRMIADVFLSTAEGETVYSVIPIENTIDGSVGLHTDWLVDEVDLPIQTEWVFPSIQNLIGLSSELKKENDTIAYDRIVKVLSHPVAMAQCLQYLRKYMPHAELEHVGSTSEAVRIVRDNPNRGWSAIGQLSAAADNNLDVLKRGVTDHDNNFTRFLLVGPDPFQNGEPNLYKTSILITFPDDHPGALHQVLSAFSWRRINLSRIESRPTKKKLGNYYFLIDINMSMDTVLLPAAIAEIEAIGYQVRVLGSYPSYNYRME